MTAGLLQPDVVQDRRGGRGSAARREWSRFLAGRLLGLLLTAVCLLIGSFVMVRLIPGDPAAYIAGQEGTAQRIVQIRHELGLDQSTLTQFKDYADGVLSGDLGISFQTRKPVSQVISDNIGPSLQLAGAAIALVLIFGIGGGMLMAQLTRENRRPRFELGFTSLASVLGAVPDYLLATFLTAIFAVALEWLPVSGTDGVSTLVLPALALAIPQIAILARLVRVETLNVLAQDYVRTARSKRLSGGLIFRRHVFPNVVTGALTLGGIVFANLVGGAVVVEKVFARPGLGSALVDAVLSRDYPVIQALILLLGMAVVIVNTGVDVLLGLADPRTRKRTS